MKWVNKICVALCMVAVCAKAELQTARVGMYTYTYRVVDGEAEIYNDGNRAIEPRPQGTFTIPSKLNGLPVTIGSYAFLNCKELRSVIIPKDVSTIYPTAFFDCVNLISFSVDSNNLNYVSRDGVLYDRTNKMLMKFPPSKSGEYRIPDDMSVIGIDAFENSCNLTSLTLSSNATDTIMLMTSVEGNKQTPSFRVVQEIINGHVLGGCVKLTSILVDSNNPTYTSVDGVLFNKEKTILIKYPPKKTGNYVIPEGVESIGIKAFEYCANLQSVTIPESVTNIGYMAFQHSSITSLELPASIKTIDDYVFFDCKRLTTVRLKCAKPKQFGVDRGGSTIFHATPVTKIIVPRDMGWANGEMFGGKPVEVR